MQSSSIFVHRVSDVSRRRAVARFLSTACVALALAASARAHGDTVRVDLDSSSPTCKVRGSFEVPVSPWIAWSVLADYEHIGDFVSSVRSSRIERRDADRMLLRQEAVASMFMVRRRVQVLLEIREDPIRRIDFRDVLGTDFVRYAGAWRVAPDSTGTHVDYELEAESRSGIGRALCRGMLRRTARDLLEQVRAEIMRRAPVDGPENIAGSGDARGAKTEAPAGSSP